MFGDGVSTGMLGRVHPLFKMAAAVLLFVVAMNVTDPALLFAYLSALTLALLMSGAGSNSLRAYAMLFPLAVLAAALGIHGGRGLDASLLSAMRVMTVAVSIAMFAYTTTPAQTIRGLESVRVPRSMVLATAVMTRFIPVLFRDLLRVRSSNRLRGGGQRRTLQFHYRSLMVPVIGRVYTLSDSVTKSLEVRGYDPHSDRTNLRVLKVGVWDFVFALSFIILSAGVLLL